jgi:undecaprenyl-diphosphatase
MEYISIIIYGVVQGITEFLPISSSGHLVILHKIFPLNFINEISFDIFLHLASLSAVVYFFRKDIGRIFKGWIKSFSGEKNNDARLAWLIIIATIPAALAGYFLEDFIENKLRSILVVVFMLVFVALLFILFEKKGKFKKNAQELSWLNAFYIGLAQALALIPGTSRSGITIIAGLGLGLKRQEAIRFSFLMSIPIIFGAFLSKISEISNNFNFQNNFLLLILAFFSTFLTAFFVIKYFLRFAEKHTLISFAYYRIILAIILLFYLYF